MLHAEYIEHVRLRDFTYFYTLSIANLIFRIKDDWIGWGKTYIIGLKFKSHG